MRRFAPALLLALLLPATARADGVRITERFFDADGWPSMVANYAPDGRTATPSWARCAPGCGDPVATNQLYAAGPTDPGTVFEASTTVGGTTTTDRTPAWGGRVTSTAAPAFTGEPRIGATLTPRAGSWSGGWGDDFSYLGMRACRTPDGGDCRAMSPSLAQGGAPQVSVDAAYAG